MPKPASQEAVWRFILDTFGRQAAVDVLSGFKAGRTLDAGFRRIGFDLEGVLAAAQAHHLIGGAAPETGDWNGLRLSARPESYAKRSLGDLPHRARRKFEHARFATSADGRWTAWTTDERGQVSVWVSDGTRSRRVARYDHKLERIVDPTYPVLAWHPSAPILAHIHEEQGRAFLTTTDVESREQAERELSGSRRRSTSTGPRMAAAWSSVGFGRGNPTSTSTTPSPGRRCPSGKTPGMTCIQIGCRMAAASCSAATAPTPERTPRPGRCVHSATCGSGPPEPRPSSGSRTPRRTRSNPKP